MMQNDPHTRRGELLALAEAADERALKASDDDVRHVWQHIAREWRALADQAVRISRL